MRKKLLLHIGPPKTGTSAIQKWCMENQVELDRKGIFYPTHTVGKNDISSGHADLVLKRTQEAKYEFDREKFVTLLAEFNTSGCHTLLLSSEYFFYFVKDIIREFSDFKVVAYVRSPIAQIESAYNQTVKRHGQTKRFRSTKNLHLTTLNRLADIIEQLKILQFDVRAYLEAEEFDVVTDFVDSIGSDLKASGITINPSYTYEALEFKRWLNQFELGELDEQVDYKLQSLRMGTHLYTLIDPNRLARFLRQERIALRSFHKKFKVCGYKALVKEANNRKKLLNKSQEHINDVLQYIATHFSHAHSQLYFNLCKRLKAQSHPGIDNSSIKVFCSKLSWSKKLALFLRIQL